MALRRDFRAVPGPRPSAIIMKRAIDPARQRSCPAPVRVDLISVVPVRALQLLGVDLQRFGLDHAKNPIISELLKAQG